MNNNNCKKRVLANGINTGKKVLQSILHLAKNLHIVTKL